VVREEDVGDAAARGGGAAAGAAAECGGGGLERARVQEREGEWARADQAAKRLLADIGRLLLTARSASPAESRLRGAGGGAVVGLGVQKASEARALAQVAVKVLDAMVWVRAAAPFALLDGVAAAVAECGGLDVAQVCQKSPILKQMRR